MAQPNSTAQNSLSFNVKKKRSTEKRQDFFFPRPLSKVSFQKSSCRLPRRWCVLADSRCWRDLTFHCVHEVKRPRPINRREKRALDEKINNQVRTFKTNNKTGNILQHPSCDRHVLFAKSLRWMGILHSAASSTAGSRRAWRPTKIPHSVLNGARPGKLASAAVNPDQKLWILGRK